MSTAETTVFTHAEYMAAPREAQAAAHRRFFAQGVTDGLTRLVAQIIGAEAIKASTDRHMNDIPLIRWDRLAPSVRSAALSLNKRTGAGSQVSLSDCVCLAKEAAKQWKEAQP